MSSDPADHPKITPFMIIVSVSLTLQFLAGSVLLYRGAMQNVSHAAEPVPMSQVLHQIGGTAP